MTPRWQIDLTTRFENITVKKIIKKDKPEDVYWGNTTSLERKGIEFEDDFGRKHWVSAGELGPNFYEAFKEGSKLSLQIKEHVIGISVLE